MIPACLWASRSDFDGLFYLQEGGRDGGWRMEDGGCNFGDGILQIVIVVEMMTNKLSRALGLPLPPVSTPNQPPPTPS